MAFFFFLGLFIVCLRWFSRDSSFISSEIGMNLKRGWMNCARDSTHVSRNSLTYGVLGAFIFNLGAYVARDLPQDFVQYAHKTLNSWHLGVIGLSSLILGHDIDQDCLEICSSLHSVCWVLWLFYLFYCFNLAFVAVYINRLFNILIIYSVFLRTRMEQRKFIKMKIRIWIFNFNWGNQSIRT